MIPHGFFGGEGAEGGGGGGRRESEHCPGRSDLIVGQRTNPHFNPHRASVILPSGGASCQNLYEQQQPLFASSSAAASAAVVDKCKQDVTQNGSYGGEKGGGGGGGTLGSASGGTIHNNFGGGGGGGTLGSASGGTIHNNFTGQRCSYFDQSNFQLQQPQRQEYLELPNQTEHLQRQQYHHHQQQPQQQQQQQQHWFPNVQYHTNCIPQGLQDSYTGTTWMANTGDRTNPPSEFPDSPPDSGSEPYSPPNGNRNHQEQQGTNGKGNMLNGNAVGNCLPVQMYMNPHNHTLALASSHCQEQTNLPASHLHQQQMSAMVSHPFLHGPSHHSMAAFGLPKPGYNPYSCGSVSSEQHPKLNHTSSSQMLNNPICTQQLLPAQLNSINNVSNPPKKRKYSDSPTGTLTPGIMSRMGGIKPEPCPPDLHYGIPQDCSEDDSYSYDFVTDSGMFLDGTYQVIKWTSHQLTKWATILDESGKELLGLNYRVDADKGFNFAPPDDAFVCQKKNHFQVTVHISLAGSAKFVKPVEGNVSTIDSLYLHFYGVKMESPSQTIKVEQSQSDRSKKQFHPIKIEIPVDQVTKVTVGRLHFSETTSNNMRKKGKPNPDQRYFQLVVALQAHCGNDIHMITAHASERIIVRASNPGQFENDMEASWSKGKAPDAIYHVGRVGINTESPDEALTIHGNMRLTGHVISPSDVRAKKDFVELDTREQLKNIAQLKVYQYSFNEEFAKYAGLSDDELTDTGILAQDLSQILPDAVRETGDVVLPSGQTIDNFLVVNKERIFIENVGAVKELSKVTDKLENRITEIEIINKKLAKINALRGSFKSICSSISVSACSFASRSDSKSSSSQNAATNPPSNTTNQHRHHHRRRHHERDSGCSPEQQSLQQQQQQQRQAAPNICSSRAIQIAVIALVLVMALCLIAITVLYVIDRQKYTPPHPEAAFAKNTFINSTQSLTTVTEKTSTSASDLFVLDGPEPLLPSECLQHPQYCSFQCCGLSTPPPQYDPGAAGFSQSVVTMTTTKPPKKTKKPTKSPNDVNYEFEDEEDMISRDQPASTKTLLKQLLKLNTPAYRNENQQIVVMKQKNITTTTSSTNDTSDEAVENNIVHFLKQPVVIQATKSNDVVNDVHSGKMDDYYPTDHKDINMRNRMVQLYFKQLNRTLSTTYCTNSNCKEETGGNYSYAVPLSANFPPLFMTIAFTSINKDILIDVNLCSEKEDAVCSQTEADLSIVAKQTADKEWDLPVGYYSNTMYTFRVFPLNQGISSADVCRLRSSNVGSNYSEYNLKFYRVCSAA